MQYLHLTDDKTDPGPPDEDVAFKLAAEGSKACYRKAAVRPFPGE